MKEFLGIDKSEWEYIRYILFQNFVVSTFILLFMWEGWDWNIHEYITLGSVIEIFLLLVSVPVYLSFALKLFGTMKSNRIKITSFLFCMLMSVLLICGSGMRFAANQIRMSVDTPIVEFFDEYLSHYMVWAGIIGLNAFFAFFQDNVPLKKKLGNLEMIVVIISGLLQGMIVALGVLESRVGLYTLIVGFLFLIALHIGHREKGFRKYPLFIFYNVCLMTVILYLLGWVICYGDFVEPSAISFGRF